MKRKIEGFGWIPDLPDQRDKTFSLMEPVVLPQSIDLHGVLGDCYDQGKLGSCTANAIAAALEYCQRQQGESDAATPSRLFIYYNERDMEGNIFYDSGAQIRDGIKSVNALGAPPEYDWPYDIEQFRKRPTDKAYADAILKESIAYERIDNTNLNALLGCLARGFPFVFGFTVYASFESKQVSETGLAPMPDIGGQDYVIGGHAVLAVGYDKGSATFLVRNSWGPNWSPSLNGHFWIPFEYLTNTNLASDFWKITSVK